jgi:hypothetical protein
VSTVLGFPLGRATVRMNGLCQSYDAMYLAPRELVNTMPSILFVCTGNIFRSMTAEYALKARLAPRSPIRVSSAATLAMPQEMHPDIRACLVQRGMEPSRHHQRKVPAELLHATMAPKPLVRLTQMTIETCGQYPSTGRRCHCCR